jgi:hypothetical protein
MKKLSRKFGIFGLLLSMLFCCIDDGEGASGGEIDDWLNTDLDEPEGKPESVKAAESENKNPEPLKEPSNPDDDIKNKVKELEEKAQKLEQDRMLTQFERDMQKKYGDSFKLDEIVAHLNELEKKTPGAGNALFNFTGLEMVYKAEFANRGNPPSFDKNGRVGGGSENLTELGSRIALGEATASETERYWKAVLKIK